VKAREEGPTACPPKQAAAKQENHHSDPATPPTTCIFQCSSAPSFGRLKFALFCNAPYYKKGIENLIQFCTYLAKKTQ
jgi:hypothetical protein